MPPVSLPDEVRAACAWVMERARFLGVEESAVEEYAARLVREADARAAEGEAADRDGEAAAGFAICMNAINFGSGWWPTIRKRPGHSGYGTMAAGVRDRFNGEGPWSAEELAAMDAAAIAGVVGQDPGHPLMVEFAAALRDVGGHLLAEHGGRYVAAVEGIGSIPALAARFAGWAAFADVSSYDGREIPFFKRAQLAAGGRAPRRCRPRGRAARRCDAGHPLPRRNRQRPLEPRRRPSLQVAAASEVAQHRLLTDPRAPAAGA